MKEYFSRSYRKFIPQIFLLIFLHSFASLLHAQTTERIIIKAGEDIAAVLSSHGMYRFAKFRPGIVKFKDNSFAKALLNYNVILNDMQFINPNGDTLVLTDTKLVDSIRIDSNVFYYQKGYLQVIDDYNETKLVMRQVNSVQFLKKGALGLTNPTVHTFSYADPQTNFYNGDKLMINEDVVLLKEISYYLVYKKFKQTPADYDGFSKAFPAIKNEIRKYADENKINFKTEADLNKLLKFCVEHSS
jgi:hypothetical protein